MAAGSQTEGCVIHSTAAPERPGCVGTGLVGTAPWALVGAAHTGEGPQTRETVFSTGKPASKPLRLLLFRNIFKICLQSISLPPPPELVPSLTGISATVSRRSVRPGPFRFTDSRQQSSPFSSPTAHNRRWFSTSRRVLSTPRKGPRALAPASRPFTRSLPFALRLCYLSAQEECSCCRAFAVPPPSPALGTFFPRVAHAVTDDMSFSDFICSVRVSLATEFKIASSGCKEGDRLSTFPTSFLSRVLNDLPTYPIYLVTYLIYSFLHVNTHYMRTGSLVCFHLIVHG